MAVMKTWAGVASAAVKTFIQKATATVKTVINANNVPSYRYWRLTVTRAVDDGGGVRLQYREIELRQGGSGGTNRASGATPTTNDGTTGSLANIVDGDITSASTWVSTTISDSSGNLSPAIHHTFDLGAAYPIDTLGIAHEHGVDNNSRAPRDFTLKASTSGSWAGEEVTVLTQSGLTTGWSLGVVRYFTFV
jgi:hypothetical protein